MASIGNETATDSLHPHAAALRHDDGSWRYTNRLAGESSPYLLQHAHNPVDWYPWGEEAFSKARDEDKLIFLSIGYSTCYWCHVMERLVFENPEIAAAMNDRFVSIKVDREERPDVDEIYMAAVQVYSQLTTGQAHGGWPMSVFLTPPGAGGDGDSGLKPVLAATYMPPEAAHGMAGFPQVMTHLDTVWTNNRDRAIAQAEQIAGYVRQHVSRRGETGAVSTTTAQQAADELMAAHDQRHGGFGGAPKFPQPSVLSFLLAEGRRRESAPMREAVAGTLEAMARGGIYDQIGGGFHRYSTDEKWLVPHFEKMLYDNGQLVEVYLDARDDEPDEGRRRTYERVVRETCDYVLREMVDDTGAFWSAQDAEVEAREGGSYVWTDDSVGQAISDEGLRAFAMALYGLDRGPNFRDPHDREAQPVNVLYLPRGLDEIAQQRGEAIEAVEARRREVNQVLLDARDARPQPATDDKALVSWNGMMIAALARAGSALDEPRYTEAAQRAAETILTNMRRPDEEGGGLHHTMRGGKARIAGFLEDYAFLTHGLIELHRATGRQDWLDQAARLHDEAAQRFDAHEPYGGGYFDAPAEHDRLLVRVRSQHDGAVPSANSQMVHNAADLFGLTGRREYLDRAARDAASFGGVLAHHAAGMVHMAHAVLRLVAHGVDLAEGPAPVDEHVSVTVQPRELDLRDGEANLTVRLDIADGWHIAAAGNDGEQGLTPLRIRLINAEGIDVEVRMPRPVMRRDGQAEEVAIFEGRIEVPLSLRRGTSDVAADNPALVVIYQACSDRACAEPRAVTTPLKIHL